MTGQDTRIPVWIEGRLVPFDKIAAHLEGRRHKAVSVFVMHHGRILIQRRALTKYHTPGLWANTCCTHPHWGESAAHCAARRLREELGITGLDLRAVGQVEYRAEVGGGMTEHEVVDIFTAEADESLSLRADPGEVMETAWITLAGLRRAVADTPERFTPWFRIYLAEHGALIFPD